MNVQINGNVTVHGDVIVNGRASVGAAVGEAIGDLIVLSLRVAVLLAACCVYLAARTTGSVSGLLTTGAGKTIAYMLPRRQRGEGFGDT